MWIKSLCLQTNFTLLLCDHKNPFVDAKIRTAQPQTTPYMWIQRYNITWEQNARIFHCINISVTLSPPLEHKMCSHVNATACRC